jgi:hypothetical protein
MMKTDVLYLQKRVRQLEAQNKRLRKQLAELIEPITAPSPTSEHLLAYSYSTYDVPMMDSAEKEAPDPS